jgi:hypothetical protein
VPYVDAMFLPAAQALTGCLSAAVAFLTVPPAIVGMRSGQQVVFDLSQNEDLCCEGFAWVRMGTATPLTPGPHRCNVTLWELELEMGIVRCAPMGDDQAIVPESAYIASAATLAEDFTAMRRAVCCFGELEPGYDFTVGTYTPVGPEGGCMGGSIPVRVAIPGFDNPPIP